MTDTPKPGKAIALVHWTYSREEWRSFLGWEKKRKGVFHYIWYRIWPKRNVKIPEVIITPEKVCKDNIHELFRDDDRLLKHIQIHDKGKMNIMEISYEISGGSMPGQKDIYVLVPRGKLREAIELQEKLISEGRSWMLEGL